MAGIMKLVSNLAEREGLCLVAPKHHISSVFLTSLRLSLGTFSSILCSIGGWICESTLVHLRLLLTPLKYPSQIASRIHFKSHTESSLFSDSGIFEWSR